MAANALKFNGYWEIIDNFCVYVFKSNLNICTEHNQFEIRT